MSLIFRPLIMIGSDIYDHTFAEAKHILTVHAKYGNNHLENELADTNSDSNKNPSTVKSEETVSVHVFANPDLPAKIQEKVTALYNEFLPQKLVNVYLLITLQPPEIA